LRAAHALIREKVAANIKAAPDFRSAVQAALPRVDAYGQGNKRYFPEDVVRDLHAKAAQLGVLSEPLHQHAAPGSKASSPILHSALVGPAPQPQYGYGAGAYGSLTRQSGYQAGSVAAWLAAMSPNDDTVKVTS
jgi:hypothetical protein